MGKNNKKFTIEQVMIIIKENGFELVSGDYKNVDTNLTIKDALGYYYCVSLYRLRKYKPLFVHKSNPFTIQNIKLWLVLNNVELDLISDTYVNNTSNNLQWRCLKDHCGQTFERCWDIIQRGGMCLYCVGHLVSEFNNLEYLKPNIAKEWHPTKNGDLTPSNVTCGNDSHNMWWQCSINHSHEWQASIYNRLKTGCPHCSSSKGEEKIDGLLSNKYVYCREYKFPDCKYKNSLPFDFYLTSFNLCIEYQGIQHYEPIDFAGKGYDWANNNLKLQQIKDQIKRDYCKANNIKLIEIPYWDFDNIDHILDQEININKTITA